MDTEFLVRVVTVCALLVGIANTAWIWLSKSSTENTAKFDKIEDDADALKERVGAIEGELKHLPSKEQVHDLNVKLTELGGKVASLDTSTKSMSRIVDRIDDYLRGEKAA